MNVLIDDIKRALTSNQLIIKGEENYAQVLVELCVNKIKLLCLYKIINRDFPNCKELNFKLPWLYNGSKLNLPNYKSAIVEIVENIYKFYGWIIEKADYYFEEETNEEEIKKQFINDGMPEELADHILNTDIICK